jgi:CBS-domain-containing membrane protein
MVLMNGPSINLERANYITIMIMIISNPIVFVVCAFVNVNVGGRHPSSEAGQLKY